MIRTAKFLIQALLFFCFEYSNLIGSVTWNATLLWGREKKMKREGSSFDGERSCLSAVQQMPLNLVNPTKFSISDQEKIISIVSSDSTWRSLQNTQTHPPSAPNKLCPHIIPSFLSSFGHETLEKLSRTQITAENSEADTLVMNSEMNVCLLLTFIWMFVGFIIIFCFFCFHSKNSISSLMLYRKICLSSLSSSCCTYPGDVKLKVCLK